MARCGGIIIRYTVLQYKYTYDDNVNAGMLKCMEKCRLRTSLLEV